MESLTPGPELENSQGHSRPMHSVPVPINVRCYSNSDIIVWRSEVTLRANKRHALRHLIRRFRSGDPQNISALAWLAPPLAAPGTSWRVASYGSDR